MKPHMLPVKRTPASNGVLKRLSAITRSRKQRVAATATDDFESEDHSSKISRALTIIFLIHIVVIGLIFFHQRYLGEDASKSSASAKKVAPVVTADDRSLPKLSNGDAIYRVVAGDNYTRIAAAQEIDEAELRAANNNVDIVSGLIMKIPPKRIVAMDPPELAAIRESTPLDRDRGLVEAIPLKTGGAPRAQLVRVTDRPPVTPSALAIPKAAPVSIKPAETIVAVPSGKTHVVQQGDNVWRIANRYKVDQNALMKVNGINDPKKLKLGMTLKLPR